MSQSNDNSKNNFSTNIFGDTYLPSINGKKFEEIAYSTYFDIELLPELAKEFTFYIFIGTDSGMLLNHLKQLELDPSSIYMFIEAQEIKEKFSKELLHVTKPNIVISTIEQWQEDAKTADIVKYIEVDRVQVIKSFSAQEQTYLPYNAIAQQLHDEINQLKWIHPDKFQRKIYIQRQIENCSENFNPAIKLKGLLKDKPALILAGGPSLDDYIDWIEKHQQYYVIIAVSRIARRLLTTKIVPDIFVTADPFESAFTTSKEVLAYGEKSILVSQNYAHPKLVGQWQGQHFYLGELLPWKCDYKPENIKGIGPTVANCAIHLALQMGIIDQILFGVDLCYSADGFSHVSSTDEYEQGANLGFTGVSILTNDKKSAETTYELSEARTSIALLAELAKKQGGQIINPNPGSAHIDNVLYQTIDNITIPIDSVNGYSSITESIGVPKQEEQVSHYSKILEEQNKILNEATQIIEHTKKILDLISSSQNKNNNPNNFNNIIQIEQKLEQYSNTVRSIESFGSNGYYNFTHPDKINNPDNKLCIIERYYISLFIACDLFIEFINNSIQRIQVRIIEISPGNKTEQTKIETTLKKWGQDEQYGRIVIARDKNKILYEQLTQKNKNEYENRFKEFFNISQKKQSTKQKPIVRLENIEKKLYHFFQTEDTDNLLLTIEQINQLNNEDSTALIHLAQGYLYELNDNIDQAINEYLNANNKQTLESGLKRILDITLKLGDIENTISVLKALSDISPDYLIQLANFYQIAKQHKDALDTYSQYIDINLNDIQILIKMGLLYLSLEIFDGAKFIFNHILELDKNNQTANSYLNYIRNKTHNTHATIQEVQSIECNKISLETPDVITITEYNFYNTLKNQTIDKKRLSRAEQPQTVGFIATSDNINNTKFINNIKKLHQQFEDTHFLIFYFEDNIKNSLLNVFGKQLSRIQYKKPTSIYTIVENIEIYINYADFKAVNLSSIRTANLIKLDQLIRSYCNNILAITFSSIFINETLEDTSSRLAEYFINNYKKLGFSEDDMKSGDYNFVKTLHKKALNTSSNNEHNYQYHANSSSHIKTIELALKHKNFIHFMFDFKHKMSKL